MSVKSLPLTKIDGLLIGQHYDLNPDDECYYFGQYVSGASYEASEMNDHIKNFKKGVNLKGTNQWYYKERVINLFAIMLRGAINSQQLTNITFCPIPPSKCKSDPLYDDRLLQVLNLAFRNNHADIRELVLQKNSMASSHTLGTNRNSLVELHANYYINPSEEQPPPSTIILFDDVLTKGTHFSASKRLLKERYPHAKIYGIFIARTVWS